MKKPRFSRLDVVTAIVAITALAVGGYRIVDYTIRRYTDPTRPTHIAQWRQYSAVGHRAGPANARVTIVEYSDFLCPYCRRADTTLQILRREHPNDIAVVYRHFPVHKSAFAAAEAAECASQDGQFQRMHDRLFDEQDSIGVKPWVQFAIQSGVRDTARFSQCLSDPRTRAAVLQDSSSGKQLGVVATPTFLVNNLRIVGFAGPSQLADAVSQAWSDGGEHQR